MQIDDIERRVESLGLLRHFDQRLAVDLVHPPLDHAGGEGEESCQCKDNHAGQAEEQLALHAARSSVTKL